MPPPIQSGGLAIASALLVLGACATRAVPLVLPTGHPADPATPAVSVRPTAAPTKPEEPVPSTSDASGVYACPMHPEVTSSEPGKCPKCGMVLQPAHADAQPPAHEQHR